MTIVRYNIVPVDDGGYRDGGYRVFAISPKTGKWEDCQSLFGDDSLWVTYPTKDEAEAAIAPLIKAALDNL